MSKITHINVKTPAIPRNTIISFYLSVLKVLKDLNSLRYLKAFPVADVCRFIIKIIINTPIIKNITGPYHKKYVDGFKGD